MDDTLPFFSLRAQPRPRLAPEPYHFVSATYEGAQVFHKATPEAEPQKIATLSFSGEPTRVDVARRDIFLAHFYDRLNNPEAPVFSKGHFFIKHEKKFGDATQFMLYRQTANEGVEIPFAQLMCHASGDALLSCRKALEAAACDLSAAMHHIAFGIKTHPHLGPNPT